MNLGDRVKIKDPVIFYHHPLHRNEAFNAQGLEGVVLSILHDYQGRPISPNFPIRWSLWWRGLNDPSGPT